MTAQRDWHGGLILLALTTGLVMSVCAEPDDTQTQESSKGESTIASKFDKLVDAMANRNPQPRIVVLRPGDREAIFNREYDWKEQDRVIAAVESVLKHPSPEMLVQLWAHGTDPRYCLTFNDGAAAGPKYAKNWSLGMLCREIASFQLYFPVNRATQIIRIGERPIILPKGDVKGLPEFGHAPTGITIVELQIQMCHQTIVDLPKLARLSGYEKIDADGIRQCRPQLESVIEELKKSKTGIFGKFNFPGERFEFFDASRADDVRKRYEEATKRGDIIRDAPQSLIKGKHGK